jgi:hypothetical protein
VFKELKGYKDLLDKLDHKVFRVFRDLPVFKVFKDLLVHKVCKVTKASKVFKD